MNYSDLIAGAKTHVVLFYGSACAPCMRLKPRMAKMSKELNFDFHQFNVASEMETARGLGIRVVPAVVAIKGGSAQVLFTGDMNDARIAQVLHAAGVLPDIHSAGVIGD